VAAIVARGQSAAQRYAVRGMTCSACARHVETALAHVPGVHAAHVDCASGVATVEPEQLPPPFQAVREAVAQAGYTLENEVGAVSYRDIPVGPVLIGLAAAAGLLTFYVGLITLAQDWTHAIEQLSQDRWFVVAIAAGFGTQIGLFAYLRTLHGTAAAGGVAASTGTSTAAMLACCAHHLTDVVPVLGLSGAAVFLNLYKTPLLWLGILMNLAGIAFMLRLGPYCVLAAPAMSAAGEIAEKPLL
jgi:copper chaperone CopZ